MPLYDFACPHNHRFERMCSMADCDKPTPCEGTVNELVTDDDLVAKYSVPEVATTDGLAWVDLALPDCLTATYNGKEVTRVLVRKVPCRLMAKQVFGAHSNPGGMLDHGSASNRDAAREGRYDPLNPNRRFMTKGRSWRK